LRPSWAPDAQRRRLGQKAQSALAHQQARANVEGSNFALPLSPAAGTPMKVAELKTFAVGNPPPAFGGRYFVFLKLKTACGIEGVGEGYAASFAPQAMVALIEDVFER